MSSGTAGTGAASFAAGAILAAILLAAAPAAKPAKSDELVRLNNLGIAYLAQYKPAEAEKQFRAAVALDPDYLPGHVNVGIAALAQVHYDEAIAAFTKALALDPNNIHSRFNLSLIYKLQGRAPEAMTEGLRALQIDSRDADVHYHVGSLHMTSRDYDKAIAEFDAVLKIDPNFLSAYYSLGRAWMAKGDVEKGKRFIEKHRELQTGANATPAVGLRYGEQGKYSFAMEDTGGAGPTPPLEKGAVTFVDVTPSSGIDFAPGGAVGLDKLLKPAAGGTIATPEYLRSTAGPVLGPGMAVADVDGDGREDLLFLDASPSGKGGAALFLNRGAMKFERAPAPFSPAVTAAALSAGFGDLDGDNDPDLAIALLDRVQVYVNDGKGKFTEASGAATASVQGMLGGVSLADVDHDGDLDVFAAGFLSAPRAGAAGVPRFPADWPGVASLLFVNGTPQKEEDTPGGTAPPPTSPVKLVESAGKMQVAHAGKRASGAVFSDFDNDRDVDFALASPGDGTTVYSNLRDGTFKDLAAASGLPAHLQVMGLAAGDYNRDGWIDLVATTWDGGLPRLFRNMMGDPAAGSEGKGGLFALDVTSLAEVPRQSAIPRFGVAFADLDNDGYLDILSVNGGSTEPALSVLRNDGEGRFLEAGDLTGADAIMARGGRGLAVADLDGDGDLDFVISNSGGRPTLVRNDGGNRNHWVRVAPKGLHSNKPGAGTKVEVKAGALWQKAEVVLGSGYLSQSSAVLHFGLGARSRVDAVRLLWPGGVLQDEVQAKADATFAVEELDRKGSSCPILYAWNGKEIAFVSDFLGGSAIGYRTGPDSFNYPDTDEYVRVTGDHLVERDGALELRMVNQLEETIYFDRARLLAVDHPASLEVFPDEKLMPGAPYPEFRLFAVKEARPPAAVTDEAGRDRLDAVASVDRVYAGPPSLLPFKGYAPEHRLTIDLGPLAAGAPVVLLLHGWIDYADSTSNLAAAQTGWASLVPPYVEALEPGEAGASGRWVRVMPRMGFPAGLPKTMTVDLTGLLPEGSHMVRIGTSMRIYWDRIRVATELGPAASLTAVEASRADLRYRGFPALVTPDGRAPEVYDYAKDQDRVHWKSHVGSFTRYGDVRKLLAEVDDRYVITRPGDEIAIAFPSAGLPPLPAGYVRDYLLHADGFGKDMDLNSARPDTVAPLPWHAMKSYPPRRGDGYPFSAPGALDYLDAYNTRLVVAPLAPIRGHGGGFIAPSEEPFLIAPRR